MREPSSVTNAGHSGLASQDTNTRTNEAHAVVFDSTRERHLSLSVCVFGGNYEKLASFRVS